jgi:hypothetical protein
VKHGQRWAEGTAHRLVRGCAGKRRFPSKRNAAGRADAANRANGVSTMGAYKCPLCRGWHIGNSRRRA